MAALSRSAGIINGRGQPRLTNPAVIATLPRYVAANGGFAGGSNVEFWPSINPDSRVNAVFLEANMTNNIPPPDNVTVLDPAPISTSRLPAASFETGETASLTGGELMGLGFRHGVVVRECSCWWCTCSSPTRLDEQ
jgi:hypothetical protein